MRRARDLAMAYRYLSQPKPHFLVVLGMHRSGTSLVARALSLLGADAGPISDEQQTLLSDEVHWEGFTITWINDRVLAAAGGTWDDPPRQVEGRARDSWRAKRFLWEFAGSRIATFKDPRTCLTYPVWARILPAHSIVACVRHPMEVARSLQARDHFQLEHGLDLWLAYNEGLLQHVAANRVVHWFNYDQGHSSLSRLVDVVCQDYGLSNREKALASYSTTLHRQRHNDDNLPTPVKALYVRLLDKIGHA